MQTNFDIISVAIFIAAAGLFFYRFQHEDPPLYPYLAICGACALGNWLGNNGAGAAATGLLISAMFVTIHLAFQPYRDDPERRLD